MTTSCRKSPKRRVFVVDDHPVVRDGLRGIIERQPDLTICGEAADAAAGLRGVQSTAPDLVIIDLSLAHGSGLELLKDLVIQHAGIPVLVLSMHDEMVYADRVLRAGARGYLMKGEGSGNLLIAIRRVLIGKVYVSENVMTDIASKLGKSKGDLTAIDRLSDRELQVFEMMGEGMGNADIAARMNVSTKTVQEYIARAKEKFDVLTTKDLLREAFRWRDLNSGSGARVDRNLN